MQQTTESHKHKQGFSLVERSACRRKPRRRQERAGFSLVELLVVMAIIAILMGIVIGISGGVTRGAAEAQAKAQIADLLMEFDKFQGDRGEYPVDWNDFRDWYLEKYSDTGYTITEGTLREGQDFLPIDPWGKAYQYHKMSDFVIRIRSAGPDGRFDSDADDDISNLKGSL